MEGAMRTGEIEGKNVRHVYGEPRQDWLDWLRGVSIIMVLTSHYQIDWHDAGIFKPIAAFCMRVGWSGVDMFFVLSGFLVGGLLISETKKYGRIDVIHFYLRRILKIWPALYCVPVVFVALMACYGQKTQVSLNQIWPIFLHIQNYIQTPLGHMWSLAVEEHFYLFLPILIISLNLRSNEASVRRFQGVVLGLIVLVGLSRTVCVALDWVDPRTARLLTHFRIDALLAGVLVATVYHFQPQRWAWLLQRPLSLIIIATMAAWPFAMNPNTSRLFAGLGYSSLIILFTSILLVTARAGSSLRPERHILRTAAFVGRYSYPIYLFHPFIWKIMHRAGLGDPTNSLQIFKSKGATWIIGLVIFMLLSVGIGVIFGKLIERPLLMLRNNILPPRALSLEK